MIQKLSLAFIAIFVALDTIGMVPIYVNMTSKMSEDSRRRVVDTSMLVAFVVALVFAFIGELIFRYLGITIFDFKIAGGIVLLLISLADLVGQNEAVSTASGSTGIVPLAVPLITGPGVLVTLMFQVNNIGYSITIAALLVNYILAWVLLRNSKIITGVIGRDGTAVISKIAAFLLAAIAVSMVRGGVFDAVKAFQTG